MRRRFLPGLTFALAAMTAWAGAIPFAQPAPVAIAYNRPGPETAAPTAQRTPGQSFSAVAGVNPRTAARLQARFDWRSRFAAEPAVVRADPTPLQLSTPAPQDDPTDAPTATPKPDPTATPKPDPTA